MYDLSNDDLAFLDNLLTRLAGFPDLVFSNITQGRWSEPLPEQVIRARKECHETAIECLEQWETFKIKVRKNVDVDNIKMMYDYDTLRDLIAHHFGSTTGWADRLIEDAVTKFGVTREFVITFHAVKCGIDIEQFRRRSND